MRCPAGEERAARPADVDRARYPVPDRRVPARIESLIGRWAAGGGDAHDDRGRCGRRLF